MSDFDINRNNFLGTLIIYWTVEDSTNEIICSYNEIVVEEDIF